MKEITTDYIDNWFDKNVDRSKWTHPVSNLLETKNNNPRGKMFEQFAAEAMVEEFPHLHYAKHKEFKSTISKGQPDVAFSFEEGQERYIEVKSVLEKGDGNKKNYKITRIKLRDREEKQNFHYLVMFYIHPTRGVITRSMTWETCRRGIDSGKFKWVKSWEGYSLEIDDLANFKDSDLELYDNFDVIKEYEKTEPDFLNSALDSDDTNSMIEGQLTFNF